jgi:hypothetical protein
VEGEEGHAADRALVARGWAEGRRGWR